VGVRATVRVAGEVDLVTAPVLEEALERARLDVRATVEFPELVVDLCEVSFLSAAGLHVLATVHVRCVDDGMSVRVVGDHHAVRRPMELAGLERLIANR
jgi:anti-anti-sigma factor